MDRTTSAMFVGLTASLILLFAYSNLYLRERQRYLSLWLASWSLYAVRFIFETLAAPYSGQRTLVMADLLCGVWSAALLLWGTCLFSERKLNGRWLAIFAAVSLWVIVGVSLRFPSPWVTLPAFLLSAFAYVFTGIALLRFRQATGPAKWTAGWAFILWGLHKAAYPLLRPLAWAAPYGYVLGAVFSFVCAVSIILVYLEKTKKDLKASEEKYRSIFDNAVEGIFQSTVEGRFLSINRAYARIFGYNSPEELIEEVTDIGRHLYVHPEDRQRFIKTLDDEGFVEGFELQCVRKDGKPIWVSTSARVVRNDLGDVLYYEGTLEDVTTVKDNRSKLLEAMDLASIVYWEVDTETGEFIFNDAFYAFYGTTAEREGGYRMSRQEYGKRFMHPDDMWIFNQFAEKRLSSMEREFQIDGEHRIIRRDGEVRHILARVHVSRDARGRVVRYHGANQDITERKQTEASLKASEERYHSVFETSLDGILLTRPDGTILSANKAACEMLRMREEEIIKAGRAGLMADDERMRAAVSERAKTGKWRGELTARRSDGSTFPVEISGNLFNGDNGRRMSAMILRDITERKCAEEEVQKAHQRLSDIIDFLPDATLVIDHDKKVIAWNKAIEGMTGVKKEEMLGKGDYAYTVPFYGEPRPILIDLVLERDNKFESGYNNVNVEGKRLFAETFVPKTYGGKGAYLSATASPLFDHEGNIVGAIESIRDITEHKRIGKELLESEERYRTAIESSNDAVDLVKAGHHIYVNRKFLDIFGYDSQEEVVGKPYRLIVHPDDLPKVDGYDQRRQRGEAAPGRYEFKGIRRNGKVVHIEASAAATTYQGELVTIAFLRDVTERMKAEKALEESEKRLRSLLDAVHETIILIDSEGTVLISNIVGAQRLGKSVQELVGTNLFDCFPPDVAAYRREQYNKVIALGEPVYSQDTRAGRHFESYCYPVFGEQGNVQAITIFAHEITEQKKAEEEQAKLWSAVEWAGEGIFMVDLDKRFTYVNAAFCKSCGFTREELVGKPTAITRSDSYPQSFYDSNWLDLEAGNIYSGRQTRRRKDGRPLEVELTITPVRDASGAIIQYVGVARDITEQLRMEAQLTHAQKMEAIGTLAGGVAHDFNNILTVIMGLGNLMQMSLAPDDRNRPYIDQIVASSEKAADLTQSLLAYSRQQRITLEPHGVGEVVAATVKLLKRLLPEDIELKLHRCDEKAVAMLDVSRMDQVLMNLATNARDAMTTGGTLTIRTERAELDETFREARGFGTPGAYVRLSVTDTGVGMDKETMDRIFDPFFTTKEVGKGTGLGLASVYGIVKQHNGYITVTSAPLEGTTFDIYLPLADAPSTSTVVASAKVKGGSETILVLEDDPDVRNMLTKILSGRGYATLEAANGDDAFRVFAERKESVDLVILDVVMPGKNGKEVFDEIIGIDPTVKVIFVSGYTRDVVIDKGVEKDSVDFLEKPLSVGKLLTKVREVLDRQVAAAFSSEVSCNRKVS